MSRRSSQWLATAGLMALLVMLLQPATPARMLAGVPLLVAILFGLRPPPRWGLPIALLMLPYFSFGVMEMLTTADPRLPGLLIAILTVGIFLAAMDSLRRA